MGGEELINGVDRWCLWFEGAALEELTRDSVLASRIAAVRLKRAKSKRPGTKKAARTPHLFGENRQPAGDYLGIPQTFSENRRFATVGRLTSETIANKKLFTADDPDGFLFAIISSLMFMTWQKLVGGRQKSDPSFSNTIVWNNFPLPEVDPAVRERVIDAGMAVQRAREQNPGRSLAEQYEDSSMAHDLREAHMALDDEVDRVFGLASQAPLPVRRATLLEKYMEQRQG